MKRFDEWQFWSLWALVLALSCTAAHTPSNIRCKLAALEELPDEPGEITASDVVQVVEHVRRCAKGADAGAK